MHLVVYVLDFWGRNKKARDDLADSDLAEYGLAEF